MKIPVTISLRSEQLLNGEKDHFEQQTDGTLILLDGEAQLLYQERGDGEADHSTVTLSLRPDSAQMSRSGAVTTEMLFVPGEKRSGTYFTPYGGIDLSVSTEYYRCDLSETGGKAMIRYSLEMDHHSTGSYTLKFNIKKKG